MLTTINVRRAVRTAGVALVLLLSSPLVFDAAGQCFGQNKVQYRTVDCRVLRTAHFDVHHMMTQRASGLLPRF